MSFLCSATSLTEANELIVNVAAWNDIRSQRSYPLLTATPMCCVATLIWRDELYLIKQLSLSVADPLTS